jgi:lipopolysaccharide transport system permease protein
MELYKHRHLIWSLAITDFKLKYKHSIVGVFWSLLEPLLMLTVLYIVFSNLMRVNIEHYQIFLLLGIVSWRFLENATNMSMHSITGKPDLVKKIYFPREILVIASCTTALLIALIEFTVFAAFLLTARITPGIPALIAPLLLLLEYLLALGISLTLASLNVFYRDVQWIWRVIMQAGFFATPILYTPDIFPPSYAPLFTLNPMAQIIENLRGTIIYHQPAQSTALIYTTLCVIVFLSIGAVVFRKLEPRFAEEL